MMNPSLSVIIPVKDLGSHEAAVLEKLARDAPLLNVICVGRLHADIPIVPTNLRTIASDCTLYEAMTRGAREASSDYLLFMGIDDVLIAANVADVVAGLRDVQNAAMVILPFQVGRRLVRQRATVGRLRSFHHQGVLFHRRTLLDLGGYDASYRLHSDLDLMFRMQRGGSVKSLGYALVVFSKGGASTSGRNSITSIREFSAIYRKHGVSRLVPSYAFSLALLIWYRIKYLCTRPR
jgi:hypothetical protein